MLEIPTQYLHGAYSWSLQDCKSRSELHKLHASSTCWLKAGKTPLLAHGVVTMLHLANNDSRLVVRWVEVNLEGLATVARKADFGRNPAADQHDMGQQAAKRQLRAELLLEVPEVAAGGQRLVHVLAEHILCHYAGLNVSVSLQRRRQRCQEFD